MGNKEKKRTYSTYVNHQGDSDKIDLQNWCRNLLIPPQRLASSVWTERNMTTYLIECLSFLILIKRKIKGFEQERANNSGIKYVVENL